MQNEYLCEAVSRIQYVQDLLSEKFGISLVLINCNGKEITLPSLLPQTCYENENKNNHNCLKHRFCLMNSYDPEYEEAITQCPYGLYANIFLTSIPLPDNPIYLLSGRTKNIDALKDNLQLIHSIFSLPLAITANSLSLTPLQKNKGNYKLTKQETKILHLIISGMSNKEIASLLFLSQSTVKTHLANVFKKLGVTNRTEAALVTIEKNIISG